LKTIADVLVYFVDSLSQDRLTALIKSYKEFGISARVKKCGGRSNNTRALSFEDIKRVIHFITSYAEDHALVLPGRVPGVWKHGVKLLPSSNTKVVVYKSYLKAFEDTGI